MKLKRPKILSYKETIRFHGHNGPFLAIGYKLGKYLNRKLRPRGIMDFKITVETRAKKPFTCVIDGLQCSTFATMGKGIMVVRETKGKDIIVVVEKNELTYRYRMTQKALDICLTAEDLDRAAKKILGSPLNDLWKKQIKV